MKKLMIMVVAAMASGLSAFAGTATSFAYQGVLRDANGAIISADSANITFNLYDEATEGTSLWSKNVTVSLDTNGMFNVELSGDGLASVIATAETAGKSLYIGLTVKDSAGEISPRQKMIATPLAAFAQNVTKADGDFTISGTAYFQGPISMETEDATFTAANVDTKGTLSVDGKATLNGGVHVGGAMTVADSFTVGGSQISMPVGAIIMWAGAEDNLPSDGCWKLCNGSGTYVINGVTNTIPDLRGRFIVGADSKGTSGTTYALGAKGGEVEHKLTVDEMAKHRHRYLGDDSLAGHNDTYAHDTTGNVHEFDQTSSSKTRGRQYQDEPIGGDQPHENRPPYYALCYLIKVK